MQEMNEYVRKKTVFVVMMVVFLANATTTSADRPNVLFLAVDDMNDWIGCLGTTPHAHTPNFDRLAKRGVLFSNAHTAGVFCAPSRAAIFSGQFASTTGCYRTAHYFHTSPEIESLQCSFAKAGYQTFGAGKLFHHPAGAIDQRGWSEFFLRNHAQKINGWGLESWSQETPFPKPFPNSIYNKNQEITGGLFLEWAPIPNEDEDTMADTMRVNWAVEKLKQQHDSPFFLGVGLYAPHFPNYCPQKYFDLYDPKNIPLPPYKKDDLEDLPPKIKKIKTARSRIHQRLEQLEAVDDAIHGYLACISYADAMMGRVLDALDASPYADNTIVVLWSDHGYHHGEKGDWGKHTLWERTSNVPFIWAGPRIAQGKVSDVSVSLIDMYPTLVEMCKLPLPHQRLEGTSIAKTLAHPEEAKDRNIFLPHMNPGEYAVVNCDWRYISYGDSDEELYDVRQDPNEWDNLASNPDFAAIKGRLRKSAPTSFAPPEPSYNARKDLVVDGETFYWKSGKGNYVPPQKYLPYTDSGNQKAEEADRLPSGSVSQKKKAAAQLKNILFIVCDDLNTHVSPSGYSSITTPAMSALAHEAMTFHRAFCQYPVCGPSRASLLSGLYPESTGVLNNTDDLRTTRPETVTFPQYLKENGFWTASVGKVFHSPRHEPGDRAWNAFVRFENDELPIVQKAREKFEKEYGSVEDEKNRRNWKVIQKQVSRKLNAQTPPGFGPSGLSDEQHKDGKNARQVIQWLQEKAYGKQPFFIACGIQKPHVPFLAPDAYFGLYPLDTITFQTDRPTLWNSLPSTALSKRYEAFGFQLGVENKHLRKEYMQAYHACVSFIDAQIQRILDAIKETGHWDDTLIILTSDHGYHLGDHFLWGKVTLFDIGAKVPLMIRAPGITKEGAVSQAMVELIDLYPTITDLMGLETPPHLQGASLRTLLGHPDRLGRKQYAYSVVSRGAKLGYALRNQRWRYGKWPDGEELYNLVNDPNEKRNLAHGEHQEERLENFRQVLSEIQARANERR